MFKCNLCGGLKLVQLIDFKSHPIVKHYLHNKEQLQKKYPVNLFFCDICGLTQLVNPCPPEILYDNYITLSSWKFQPHVQHEIELIKNLNNFNINSKIIEIGSNEGLFLEQLLKQGFKNIIGIEPAKDAYESSISKGINTRQLYLKKETSKDILNEYGEFDLLISRQNLEHMSDLKEASNSIKSLVKIGGYVLIEVPNFMCNLRCNDYGLWEEHVNYFTIDTLRYFLNISDIEIIYEEIIKFSGEGILVLGCKKGKMATSLSYVDDLRILNYEYSNTWPVFKNNFNEFIYSKNNTGSKIAVYGAGSRVFCLLNFLEITHLIDVILDDQPEKQNKFMPGGMIPIMPSSALYSLNIGICLLGVNTENEEKVMAKHEAWIKNGGIFWSILPPSDMLLPVWVNNGK
jgi:2-polyprenyl-3-methyl-5-hydroxy-6-metoxy-1,4-benzoquinol methylase